MFKGLIITIFFVAGTLVLFPLMPLSGQLQPDEALQPEQDAFELFESASYREALTGFRDLLRVNPNREDLHYYMGRCLVELGDDLDEAIEHLYRAANGNDVGGDATFYLARAYHLNYNFSEALKYYRQFEMKASRQEKKEFGIDHLRATCRSAMEITSAYNPYEVMNVTFIDLLDSAQFSQIKMKGGDLQYRPAVYGGETATRDNLTDLMFLSPNAVRGEYAFFADRGKNSRVGTQLFRIRKGPGNAWGDPEEIKALNTDGDEILPYFDPVENDLYFATNGQLGIGGFDLYRSHYDSERDQWTEPMNLGFPINSTMDEFLLLPGTDLGMMMFFSNRQGPDSMVTVYRVHLIEPKVETDIRNHQMLREIAGMDGIADQIQAELEALASETYPPEATQAAKTSLKEEAAGTPVITPVKILEPSDAVMFTQQIKAEAIRHQLKADSLKQLAAVTRLRIEESDDPNELWVWQKQIILWEKKSRDQQEMAEELFVLYEAEEARQKIAENRMPDTIEEDTVMNGITVFRFTSSATADGEPGTPPKQALGVQEKEDGMNRFRILDQSPYEEARSIPMDVPIPPGTFYRIQLGVYSGEVETATFKGITPITGERLTDRGLVKYYAGKFTRYSDASSALARIQSRGFEDAFVVAWYNGKPITTHQAKQLE
jgi:hypothetical protein